MSKKKSFHLTKSELGLMNILWSSERPLSRPEILERATEGGEPTIPLSTFHLMVNNLLDKQYIISVNDPNGRVKKHTRRYAANVTRNEHYALQITTSEQYKPSDIPGIVCSLFRYSGISDPTEILEEIAKMAAPRR